MKITVVLLLFVFAIPVQAAATGKGGAASRGKDRGLAAVSSPGPASIVTGRGGTGRGRTLRDPRGAPELDPTRKVSEQDCTKPLDLDGGNLRCK